MKSHLFRSVSGEGETFSFYSAVDDKKNKFDVISRSYIDLAPRSYMFLRLIWALN